MEEYYREDHPYDDLRLLDSFVDRQGNHPRVMPTKFVDGGPNFQTAFPEFYIESPGNYVSYSDQKANNDFASNEGESEALDLALLDHFQTFNNLLNPEIFDNQSAKRTHDEIKPVEDIDEHEPRTKKCVTPLKCIEYPQEKNADLPSKRFSRQNSVSSIQCNNFPDVPQNQIAEPHSMLAMPVAPSLLMAIIEEEVKANERRQIPIGPKTCFSGKPKNKVLELASVNGNEKGKFEEWGKLSDVRETKIKLQHFNLKDGKILENLKMILGRIDKLESISLDFEKTIYDASVQRQFEERLEKLLQISFEGQESLESIRLVWDRSEGAHIVSQHFLQQLQRSASTLKHLDLDFKNTKLNYEYFQVLAERVRTMQQDVSKLKTFKFAAELVSFEGERAQFNPLSMPDVKEFSLDLTCSGPFGGELMKFIIQSISSMKAIETLSLKLTIRDFRDNSSSEKWIEELFNCIQLINENMLNLKVIISLDKKDEIQDEDASLRNLVRVAANSLKVHRIRNLVIGPNVLKITELSGMSKISKFLCENIL